MNRFKIGVMAESFRMGLEKGIRKAAQIGADGLQLYALTDEFNADIINARKAEIKKLIADEGLVISALCSEMGGFAYDLEQNPQKLQETMKIMDFAAEMGTNIVTAHIGVVPKDKKQPVWLELQTVLGKLGEYGSNLHVTFAVETGPEPAVVLRDLLESINGVGANYDPANLVMIAGDDPVKGVYELKKFIVHTHAKDGVMHRATDPQSVYGSGEAPAGNEPAFTEVPLGTGSVDFPGWMRALSDIGYKGFLTIEREAGDDPVADISLAVKFLKEKMMEIPM
jgi:L-ribulose-5-phosphate 3-epimerase